jgi:hypothetical protein
MTYLLAGLALAIALAPALVWAVRLTSDDDGDRPGPPPPRPPDEGPQALARYIDRLDVEGPYSDRGLSIFTLTTRAPETSNNYLTLDDGMSSGQLVLGEKPGGSVPVLTVRNLSDRWAFLMAGEIVSGGKQNRTLSSDALIPPGGGYDLPVFCVEQHRWTTEGKFESAKAAAPHAMRAGVAQGHDQGAVWREADRAQAEAGVKSATGDVTVVYRDAKTARAVDEAAARLLELIPRREYVGLVIARGGEIVSADLFANSGLYARLHGKVIRSHVVESLGKHYAGVPNTTDVRAFLARARGAAQNVRPAPGGFGQIVRVMGNGLGGEWLLHDGRCIHAALFPQIIRPIPMPMRER